MSGWVLFQYGKSKPPKTPLGRKILTWVVMIALIVFIPFAVGGAVDGWVNPNVVSALVFTFLSLYLIGIFAAVIAQMVVSRRKQPPPGGGAPGEN